MADLLKDLVITATADHRGGVIATGYFETDDDQSPFVVVRFHPDGALDTAFGDSGLVTVRVGTCDDLAVGVAAQADGKFIVLGTAFDFGRTSQVVVMRFLPRGVLDPSFGDKGVVRLSFGSGYSQAEALSIDDGCLSIVAEGGDDYGFTTVVLGDSGSPNLATRCAPLNPWYSAMGGGPSEAAPRTSTWIPQGQ